MDMTACFLPKPVTGVNGNGMHTNLSLAENGKNLFCDPKGEDELSASSAGTSSTASWPAATDICLLLNASVNAYRRLDPHFEAPNQIKASADQPRRDGAHPDRQRALGAHRGALGRAGRQPVPGASTRCSAPASKARIGRRATETQAQPHALPARQHLRRASGSSRRSKFAAELLGEDVHDRYAELKQASAERCPKALGTLDQDGRGPVPPRGDEPVPLEPVLICGGCGGAASEPPRAALTAWQFQWCLRLSCAGR